MPNPEDPEKKNPPPGSFETIPEEDEDNEGLGNDGGGESGGFTLHFRTLDLTNAPTTTHCRDFLRIEERLKGLRRGPEQYLPGSIEDTEIQLLTGEKGISRQDLRTFLVKKRFPKLSHQKAILEKPTLEFENEIYPLLLLLEFHKNKIPGLAFKLERAINAVVNNQPFTGAIECNDSTIIRLDVVGSSTLRGRLEDEAAIEQINRDLFRAIQSILPSYSDEGIFLMETGGDEAVLTMLKIDQNIIDSFVHDLRKKLHETNPNIGFHLGIGKGKTLITTTSEGHFFINGPAYNSAKKDQDREKEEKRKGTYKTPEIAETYRRRSSDHSDTRKGAIQFTGLNPQEENFTEKLRSVLAHVLSTTIPGFLDQREQNFAHSTILMMETKPVQWTGSLEDYETEMEEMSGSIGESARKPEHEIRFTYTTPTTWLGFRGALGSPTLRQTIAALKFATEIREQEHIKCIAITQGPVHFGNMSSTSTGASPKIEQAARELALINDKGGIGIAGDEPSPLKQGIHLEDVEKFATWITQSQGAPIFIEESMLQELGKEYELINPSPPIRAFLRGVNKGDPITFIACHGIEAKQITQKLYGRDQELKQCRAIMHATLETQSPHTLKITGDHGTGKTLLIETFLRDLELEGFTTTGKIRRHHHQPFGLIRDIMRDFFGISEEATSIEEAPTFLEWLETQPWGKADFKQAVHQLENMAGTEPHPSENVLSQLLRQMTKTRPLAIVAETWDRIDRPSKKTLRNALETDESGHSPLLVIRSFTENRASVGTMIHLGELSAEGIKGIVQDALEIPETREGAELTQTIQTYLTTCDLEVAAASKNPFILKEICHRLKPFVNNETYTFNYPDAEQLKPLPSLNHFAFEKKEQLSKSQQNIMIVACLLGEGMPCEILIKTCENLNIPTSSNDLEAINKTGLAELGLGGSIHFPHAFVPKEIETLHRWDSIKKTSIHKAISKTLKENPAFSIQRSYHLCQAGEIETAIDLILATQDGKYLDMKKTEHAFQTLCDQIETLGITETPPEKLIDLFLGLAGIKSELKPAIKEILPYIERAKTIHATMPADHPDRLHYELKIHNALCKAYYLCLETKTFLEHATRDSGEELNQNSPAVIERDFYRAAAHYRREEYQEAIQKFEQVAIMAATHKETSPELTTLWLEAKRLRVMCMAYLYRKDELDLVTTMAAMEETTELFAENPTHQIPTHMCALERLKADCLTRHPHAKKDFKGADQAVRTAIAIARQYGNHPEEIASLMKLVEIQWHACSTILDNCPEGSSLEPEIVIELKAMIEESIRNARYVLSLPGLLGSKPQAPFAHTHIAEQLEHLAQIEPELTTKLYLINQAIASIQEALKTPQATQNNDLREKGLKPIQARLQKRQAELILEIRGS